MAVVGIRITDGDRGGGGGVDWDDGAVLILDRILRFVLRKGDAQVRKSAGGFVDILPLSKKWKRKSAAILLRAQFS